MGPRQKAKGQKRDEERLTATQIKAWPIPRISEQNEPIFRPNQSHLQAAATLFHFLFFRHPQSFHSFADFSVLNSAAAAYRGQQSPTGPTGPAERTTPAGTRD